MDFEPLTWLYVTVAAVAVLAALVLLYVMRAKGRRKEPLEVPEVREKWPLKIERTVTPDEAKKAQERLKMLDIEREVLSYAIRRFYEAQAEGKITEEERDRLSQKYKERMMSIRDKISRSESVVALHELEAMQDDLVKLFSERFDDINMKVAELRSRLEVKPVMETPIPPVTAPRVAPPKEKVKVRKRPLVPKKTEAEKRIEEIRAEVEKVLERLGQIEVET